MDRHDDVRLGLDDRPSRLDGLGVDARMGSHPSLHHGESEVEVPLGGGGVRMVGLHGQAEAEGGLRGVVAVGLRDVEGEVLPDEEARDDLDRIDHGPHGIRG